MDAPPPTTPESGPRASEAGPRELGAAPPAARPRRARDLIPWATEIAFVTTVLVVALVVFLVLTSGGNPFAAAVIPIIVVLAVIAAVVRHRWISHHRTDAGFVHARHAARERRGF